MSQCSRVLEVLRDGRPHSIQEIHELAGTMRLNSRVADLRRMGFHVIYYRKDGLHTYQLVDGTVRAERGQGSAASGGNPSLLGPSLDAGGPTPEPLAGSAHGEGEGLSPAGPGSVVPIEGQAQLLIWEAA